MVRRSGDVVEALHRRNIDLCCNKGTAGIGMFIAEKWIDSVADVVRVNEQIMYVKLVIKKHIENIVSAYAPQVGLSAEEKDDLCCALWNC